MKGYRTNQTKARSIGRADLDQGRVMKPFVLIAAIVAVVSFGAAVAVAKERSEVKTSVTLKFDERRPADSFSGRVKAKKGCDKKRRVLLRSTHPGLTRGSDKTNSRGRYEISFEADPSASKFFAKASEKKISKNNGDTIVCESARSNQVRVRQ